MLLVDIVSRRRCGLCRGREAVCESGGTFWSSRLDLCFLVPPLERYAPSVLGRGLRLRAHAAARQRLVRGAGLNCLDAVRMGLDMGGSPGMTLRSPLGRVLGLGSAKDGTGHWWAQRVSAVALIPLTLWFLFSLLLLPALDYETVRVWLAQPLSSLLAILSIGVLTYHSYLGTTVIIEDYVHSGSAKVASLMLLRFLYVLIGGASILAILRVAFGSLAP